jgi:hypothetical protein
MKIRYYIYISLSLSLFLERCICKLILLLVQHLFGICSSNNPGNEMDISIDIIREVVSITALQIVNLAVDDYESSHHTCTYFKTYIYIHTHIYTYIYIHKYIYTYTYK